MSNLVATEQDLAPSPQSSRELDLPLKVRFYPTTDDLAYITQKIHNSRKLGTRSQLALQGFLVTNLVALPAIFLFLDAWLIGLAALAINALFVIGFLPALLTSDYRTYFREMFGSIEDDIVEVELTDEGIWCRHSGNISFFPWANITLVEETKQAIYFFYEHNGMAVAKTGFAYDEEKDRFLAFAKTRVRNFNTV